MVLNYPCPLALELLDLALVPPLPYLSHRHLRSVPTTMLPEYQEPFGMPLFPRPTLLIHYAPMDIGLESSSSLHPHGPTLIQSKLSLAFPWAHAVAS